jgi:hypothetical protein
MDSRFGLKIREPFTVSAFSLTVWQTLLHILINVYWNKSGLIQTDATHNIVVNSSLACLITESITIYSVHLHFQCNKVYCLHIIWQKSEDNSFYFRFQNWERSTIEKTTWQHGMDFSFPMLFFVNTKMLFKKPL